MIDRLQRTIETQRKRHNKNIKLLGRGPRTGATQAVPRRMSSWIWSVHPCAIIMNTMTNDCPFTKAQPFNPLSTNLLFGPLTFEPNTNLGSLQIKSLQQFIQNYFKILTRHSFFFLLQLLCNYYYYFLLSKNNTYSFFFF